MDHNQAVESQAVERYFLRAMSTEELDDFEEHYFACAVCGDDVRTAARLRQTARQVLAETRPAPDALSALPTRPGTPHTEPRPRESGRWWQWPILAPTFAAAALLGVVIYQASNRQGVQPIAVIALQATTRGDSDIARIPPGGRFFTIYFDVPPAPAPYECTITNSAGGIIAVVPTAAPKPAEPVNLLLNRSDFPPGQYTITVRGNEKPFPLQLKFVVE